MLGKRTRPLIITKLPDPLTTPKCSLEFRIVSPRSLKNSDPVAGVGLAIVAALEKSSCGDVSVSFPIIVARSNPIAIHGTKCKHTDKGEDGGAGHDRSGCGVMTYNKSSDIFYVSPPRRITKANNALPPLDFLNSCGLCSKKLHGRDIYMYRGEKAFCSAECRCRQIIMDDHKEKCGSELSRSVDMSSSPCSRDNIFFTGIIVA